MPRGKVSLSEGETSVKGGESPGAVRLPKVSPRVFCLSQGAGALVEGTRPALKDVRRLPEIDSLSFVLATGII